MKTKLLSIILLLIISSNILSQSINIDFSKCYGGSFSDRGRGILKVDDGRYLIVGYTGSDDGDVHGQHSGGIDYWAIMIDSTGTILKSKCYGGSELEMASNCATIANSPYFLITGTTNSNDFDVSGKHNPSLNFYNDAWTIKIDTGLNLIWQRCTGGYYDESAFRVRSIGDSEIVVIGSSQSNDGDLAGNINHSLGEDDIMLAILDTAGVQKRASLIGGSVYDFGKDYQVLSPNERILGGNPYSTDGDVQCVLSNQASDGWVAIVDSLNHILAGRCMHGFDWDDVINVFSMNNDTIIAFGNTSSHDGDMIANTGGTSIYAAKFDRNLNLISIKFFGSQGITSVDNVIRAQDGGFLIAGTTDSSSTFFCGQFAGPNGLLLKVDSLLNFEWSHCFGGTGLDELFSVLELTPDNFIVCGQTTSNNFDVSGNHGGVDVWVLKFRNLPNDIPDVHLTGSNVKWLADDHTLKIDLNFAERKSHKYTFILRDLIGRELLKTCETLHSGDNYFTMPNSLPASIYLISILGVDNRSMSTLPIYIH